MSLDDLTMLLLWISIFMGGILGLWIAERFADRLWPKDPDELRIYRERRNDRK